jgi:ATP-dependent DNA helicase RecG
MDWLAVLKRIEGGEDGRTEFKRDVDLKKVGRTITAFANSDGGVLILGIEDNSASLGVQEDAEKVSERHTSFLQNGLSTPVQAKLGRNHSPNGWVHWIEIPRQRGFEPLRFASHVYVRRGRASVEPSAAELADLYNAFGYIITEERPIAAATIHDVDIGSFDTYLARIGLNRHMEPQLDLADDLRARGVVAMMGEEARATLYGVLAFGRSPQAYPQTQNFFIQCVSYAGMDQSAEVLEVADAKGCLDDQVDRALGWIAGQRRYEIYEPHRRVDVPLLPREAAREVIVNAVAHRDYAILGSKILVERFTDRVEVTSPGRLPNGMTPESVRRGGNPRARNQSITNFLFSMGKMEQRGRGWPIAIRSMQDHNGTLPELAEDRDARWVRVTLRTLAALEENE